jgi:ribosome recycling factor
MSIQEDIIADMHDNVAKTLDAMKSALGKLRTGRASIAILDSVRVNYYGQTTPLTQCANLAVADPRLITIKPWDKGMIVEIEKAITAANLGLNPQNNGDIIRLPIPSLTEERRKDIVKQARHRGEEGKIAVRNARRDANEMLKEAEKDKQISEDDLTRSLEKIQEITDEGIKAVEELVNKKEKEILDV